MNIAIKCYEDACKADPSDPLPPSNLAAALFECGRYAQCITASDQACNLANTGDNIDHAFLNKNKTRKARALAVLGQLTEALSYLDQSTELNSELVTLRTTIQRSLAVQSADKDVDTTSGGHALRKIIEELPRFKSVL